MRRRIPPGRRGAGGRHVCLTCAAVRRRVPHGTGRGLPAVERRWRGPISASRVSAGGGARLWTGAGGGGAGLGRRRCYDGQCWGPAPSGAAILLLIRTAGRAAWCRQPLAGQAGPAPVSRGGRGPGAGRGAGEGKGRAGRAAVGGEGARTGRAATRGAGENRARPREGGMAERRAQCGPIEAGKARGGPVGAGKSAARPRGGGRQRAGAAPSGAGGTERRARAGAAGTVPRR